MLKQWDGGMFHKITFMSEAKRKGLDTFLDSCIKEEPTRYHLQAHLKVVRNCNNIRKTAEMIRSCNRMMEQGDFEDINDVLVGLTDRTYNLLKKSRSASSVLTGNEIANPFVAETKKRVAVYRSGKLPGHTTGINPIDEVTGGFRPGEYIVIGGQRSQGKTDLAVNFAVTLAMNDVGVAIISIEMGSHDIWIRAQSLMTAIWRGKIRDGQLTDDEIEVIKRGTDTLKSKPIMISDIPHQRLADIRAVIQEAIYKIDAKVAIIDYIGLIESSKSQSKNMSREREVAEISAGLKAIARENNITVIVLSQFNRVIAFRKPPTPELDDFRDSGSIEQDADIAILISHSFDENNKPIDHAIRIDIAKNRNGRTRCLEMMDYDRSTGKIGIILSKEPEYVDEIDEGVPF
jgi:replicative DNA helicase